MASNSSGGRGLIGSIISLVLLVAIIYGVYYAFGGSPEDFAAAVVNFGQSAFDFIARFMRSAIDAVRN